jgi:hypothetical protein
MCNGGKVTLSWKKNSSFNGYGSWTKVTNPFNRLVMRHKMSDIFFTV